MPRDLFGNVTRPSISIGNRKWYTLPLSLFSHSAIVLGLIALPILAPSVMPSVFADNDVDWIPTVLPPPPPPPIHREQPAKPTSDPNLAPVIAPDTISPEPPRLEPIEYETPGIVGGSIDDASTVLMPPPPAAAVPQPPKPLQVGGVIRRPTKVGGPDPVYPPMARAAGVQGIVIIEATIGADGSIINARILRSLPLLDQAALEAVRQWQYSPTMLNGVAVPVIMTVTVNFTLK